MQNSLLSSRRAEDPWEVQINQPHLSPCESDVVANPGKEFHASEGGEDDSI